MLKKYFIPKNRAVLVVSLIISTIIPLFIAYFFYPRLMDYIPVYSDFIAYHTTWDGYNKAGDLQLFHIFFYSYMFLLVFTP
jgi:hypothetical protein